MYEENLTRLPQGDAAVAFANELREIAKFGGTPSPVIPKNVVQMANEEMQPPFADLCGRLLLPGSSIVGWENVQELGQHSRAGASCLLCLSHSSNLDVPTLYTILKDQKAPPDVDVFQQIIWIAGRKLSEDSPLTQILIQAFNRIVVTPPSWFSLDRSEEELREAHRINRVAQREMVKLRHQGRIFGLFPAGTRLRPHKKSTAHAIPETDTYVKTFDYMVLGRIRGCTMPVSKDRDFTHETPARDRVVYRFGTVQRTSEWRSVALNRFPDQGQRAATAYAIEKDIDSL
jgi:hypothetical protein